ncbi:hypothetical protein B0H16DRAFT_1821338 [Mycena metata]|uniref:Uncharacterized protein n=1 Tax=Mycena metata TaxID=1033252 RepID=A0AAD7H211_9AGAR|nr:hypothetical protein B0H16DRAFT_1821338 [Mycena metata]
MDGTLEFFCLAIGSLLSHQYQARPASRVKFGGRRSSVSSLFQVGYTIGLGVHGEGRRSTGGMHGGRSLRNLKYIKQTSRIRAPICTTEISPSTVSADLLGGSVVTLFWLEDKTDTTEHRRSRCDPRIVLAFHGTKEKRIAKNSVNILSSGPANRGWVVAVIAVSELE